MTTASHLVADSVNDLSSFGSPVPVSLSNEIVQLLSEQLYQSPLKAIEELVVNSYDADAKECRVFVPAQSDILRNYIVVYDDGTGMSREGLVNLWQIGRSNKRSAEIEKRSHRKLIGKFGIGKLATFTIANRLTYITKTQKTILSVTVNFKDFSTSPTGAGNEVHLPVRRIDDWLQFCTDTGLSSILSSACIDSNKLGKDEASTWTIAILEEPKEKAKRIKLSELQWVLSTAMPLKADFQLYLNCDEIISSKENYEKPVEFNLIDLPTNRLKSLQESTGEEWFVNNGMLKSRDSFKAGISGSVIVTEKSLAGKSDDLIRSHGFFVRVRDRLVNESDPLFGLKALFHGTFNRFRADIQADDLDSGLKASRETVEDSKSRDIFRTVLREIFNEANIRYENRDGAPNPKREGERMIVPPRLFEYPVADVLSFYRNSGAEADGSWFYVKLDPETNLSELIHSLYTDPRNKYRYDYVQNKSTDRLVQFDPVTHTFWINQNHDLAKEYSHDGASKRLLEDIVTAEALLEVYLREQNIIPHVVGEILERRDSLFRSLARDHSTSFAAIAKLIRDSAADEYELEIALVVAARALGFVANHISGSGKPDGVARFIDHPNGEKLITLEAKSSIKTPNLGAIDFGGLMEHTLEWEGKRADGCLLVAPSYPGKDREEASAVSRRARELKISCWTVEQFAQFIEIAEARHLTARNILDIVLKSFAPEDVTLAINAMLAEPTWNTKELYHVVLTALRQMEGRVSDRPKSIDMIALQVSHNPNFQTIAGQTVEQAVRELAGASQGGMTYRDNHVIVHVSQDELERRLESLTKNSSGFRRISNFRDP